MLFDPGALGALGWKPFFQSQLDLDELETTIPARIAAVHRGRIDLIRPSGPDSADTRHDLPAGALAVGDWVLSDPGTATPLRLLDRSSLLQRRAAGTGREAQLIAANIDTLFVTSSCNADFNPARLERYLALAAQSDITPVLVLTKADMADSAEDYAAQASDLARGLIVETVDARDPESLRGLRAWCGKGQTVGFVGSSGVGKSTLVNTLTGDDQDTAGIREDDAKGRHTTTSRSLHRMPTGAWLIDTPGMRALRLYDVAEGVETVFSDIANLAHDCRFSDCGHDTEPGCAVRAAIADGLLDPARLARWQKLEREDRLNTASIAERHAADRALGRMYREGKAHARRKRDFPD